MKIIAFSGTTFPSVLIRSIKSFPCSVCKFELRTTNLKGAGGKNARIEMHYSIQTLRNHFAVSGNIKESK